MIAASLLAPGLLAGACGGTSGEDDRGGSNRPRIVAALAPLAELAEQVGGDGVQVDDLVPAGGEPHDLELTTDQLDDVLDADVALVVGGGFQPSVEDAVEGSDAEVVELAPHAWLDPTVMAEAAGRLAEALAEVDPDGADRYRAAGRAHALDLGAFDAEAKAGLAKCERREIITAHAAFDPFAERYGLTAVSVAGSTPDTEPDPRRLAELTDRIRSTGTTTVFTEPGAEDADLAATLAREAGVATALLDPAERLPEGTTFLDVQRSNLATLRAALGCR